LDREDQSEQGGDIQALGGEITVNYDSKLSKEDTT